jgi:formamidopyrimidine-DNA glycosylase
MPELPEVETIRIQLEPALAGRRIEELVVLDERWTRPVDPGDVETAVRGATVSGVGRRGKYLLIEFEDYSSLSIHLRMTGNLMIGSSREEADPPRLGGSRLYEPTPDLTHLRARFTLDDSSTLLFCDVRRFGHAVYFPDRESRTRYLDDRLGIEPLDGDLTGESLFEISRDRRTPLKSFLLDQHGVAGIGNIYADEALHRAGLHPLSPAASMRPEHCDALAEGIVDALHLGLENGGASIDDYRDLAGEKGQMQDEFLVHTREGEECPRCEGQVSRIVVAGRSTYYCGGCQKRLRRSPRRSRKRRPAGRAT